MIKLAILFFLVGSVYAQNTSTLVSEVEYSCEKGADCYRIQKKMFDAETYIRSAKGNLSESYLRATRAAAGITEDMVDDERDEETPKRLYRLAMGIYKDLCEKPIGQACYEVGRYYNEGAYTEKNESEALYFLNKSCRLNYVDACTDLASILSNQEDKARKKVAYSMLEKACFRKNSDPNACYKLSSLNPNIEVDQKVKLLKLACPDGNVKRNFPACLELGHIYKEGKLVKQDFNKSFSIFEQACFSPPLDTAPRCDLLSEMYDKGLGVPKDPFLAQRYLLKGSPDENNFEKITGLFEKSCNLNNEISCRNAGVSYVRGFGVEIDYVKAYRLLKKSCNLGDAQACSLEKTLLSQQGSKIIN